MARKERKKREPRKTVIHPYLNTSEIKAVLFNELRANNANARLDVRTKGGKLDLVVFSHSETVDPAHIICTIAVKPSQWTQDMKHNWLNRTANGSKYNHAPGNTLVCTSVNDLQNTIETVLEMIREWG